MVLLPLLIMKGQIILLALFLVYLSACDQDDSPSSTLLSYIQGSGLALVKDDLIACAASGENESSDDQEEQISIFFYPEGKAHTFKYFETSYDVVDPDDYTFYTEKILVDVPVFNGYLRRFQRVENETPIWCLVTFIKNGDLHISNPIKLKSPDLSTEFNSSLLRIDSDEKLSPSFSWDDGSSKENEIYFHVISDAEGNLISGTYTFEKQFQFYNLDNVVLNIREIMPIPALDPESTYTITIMGVSIDNWVNLIIEKNFSTF